MGKDGILVVDNQVVLKDTDGIQHQVFIDTSSLTVTKRFVNREKRGISARECLENEVAFLRHCSKFEFVPRLYSVNYDELSITMQYVGEPIWVHGQWSGDPTRTTYLFAVKPKFKTRDIHCQVMRIIRTLLIEERIDTEFFINNFAVSSHSRVFYVDFDKAQKLALAPENVDEMKKKYLWWEERWNYWIPLTIDS